MPTIFSGMQCVAVSVLQGVAVCCSVLQCIVKVSPKGLRAHCLLWDAMCCSQRVAGCCRVLQDVAVSDNCCDAPIAHPVLEIPLFLFFSLAHAHAVVLALSLCVHSCFLNRHHEPNLCSLIMTK